MQPNRDPSSQPRPWGRVSTVRLETFSDGVFAIAVTLLALQLKRPNLEGATTAGAVLHALAQQRRQFGFYALTFLLTGGLWSAHHQLLDPLETHGRRLPAANLWFLLSVSLLPYWVNVLATYPDNDAAAGMFVLWLGVAQFTFLLVCLVVRGEVGKGGRPRRPHRAQDDPRRQRGGVAGPVRRPAGRPGAGARRGGLRVAGAAGGRGPVGGACVVGPPSTRHRPHLGHASGSSG